MISSWRVFSRSCAVVSFARNIGGVRFAGVWLFDDRLEETGTELDI